MNEGGSHGALAGVVPFCERGRAGAAGGVGRGLGQDPRRRFDDGPWCVAELQPPQPPHVGRLERVVQRHRCVRREVVERHAYGHGLEGGGVPGDLALDLRVVGAGLGHDLLDLGGENADEESDLVEEGLELGGEVKDDLHRGALVWATGVVTAALHKGPRAFNSGRSRLQRSPAQDGRQTRRTRYHAKSSPPKSAEEPLFFPSSLCDSQAV